MKYFNDKLKNRDRGVVMLNSWNEVFYIMDNEDIFCDNANVSARSRAEVFVRGTEIADNLTIAWNINGHYFLHNFSLIIHYASRLWKNVNFPQASVFYLFASRGAWASLSVHPLPQLLSRLNPFLRYPFRGRSFPTDP